MADYLDLEMVGVMEDHWADMKVDESAVRMVDDWVSYEAEWMVGCSDIVQVVVMVGCLAEKLVEMVAMSVR